MVQVGLVGGGNWLHPGEVSLTFPANFQRGGALKLPIQFAIINLCVVGSTILPPNLHSE
jgi:hypothetical protein